MKQWAPSSMASRLARSATLADTMMTGITRAISCCCSCCSTANPSMSGRRRSRMMTSGSVAMAAARPLPPSCMAKGSWPTAFSRSRSARAISRSSSISRMRRERANAFSVSGRAARQRQVAQRPEARNQRLALLGQAPDADRLHLDGEGAVGDLGRMFRETIAQPVRLRAEVGIALVHRQQDPGVGAEPHEDIFALHLLLQEGIAIVGGGGIDRAGHRDPDVRHVERRRPFARELRYVAGNDGGRIEDGKGEREGRALAHRAFHRDLAEIEIGQLAHDAEAEAESLGGVAQPARLLEALEDHLELFGGNAGSAIADADDDLARVRGATRPQPHAALLAAIFEGVDAEIDQHAADLL